MEGCSPEQPSKSALQRRGFGRKPKIKISVKNELARQGRTLQETPKKGETAHQEMCPLKDAEINRHIKNVPFRKTILQNHKNLLPYLTPLPNLALRLTIVHQFLLGDEPISRWMNASSP